MKQFGTRMLAVMMAIVTLMLVDILILGTLPVVIGAALLPLSAWATARLFRAGLRPAGGRARRPHHTPPRHRAATPRPQPRVVTSTDAPGGRAA